MGLQIDEMQPSACRAGYRLVFGVGRILVLIVEGVLNVQVGIRAGENERSHCSRSMNKSLAKVLFEERWISLWQVILRGLAWAAMMLTATQD